jgi:hypothetical protein
MTPLPTQIPLQGDISMYLFRKIKIILPFFTLSPFQTTHAIDMTLYTEFLLYCIDLGGVQATRVKKFEHGPYPESVHTFNAGRELIIVTTLFYYKFILYQPYRV